MEPQSTGRASGAEIALLFQVLGSIDGSGKITLVDPTAAPDEPLPVDLDLELVLGSMPNKTFRFERTPFTPEPLSIPEVQTECLPSTSTHTRQNKKMPVNE